MERLNGTASVPAQWRGGIVALGNFDGFHRGHQAVVGRAIARARAEGRPAIVATFDPHPIQYFKPDAEAFRLTTLDQRQQLFAESGADAMFVFGFDADLASLSAHEFVAERLVERIGAAGVVTGTDFTFGKGRDGDVSVLSALGEEFGFGVDTVPPVMDGDQVISSSRIRKALRTGDMREAAALLSRPFTIEGVVEPGAKLGRELGYPTANLRIGEYIRPRYGIYAVRGRLADGRVVEGVANLGIRPTIEPPVELLEPYFFDFSGDLYGQTIGVELIEFLRDEAKFDDLDTLKTAIAADCEAAKRALRG